MFLYFWLAVFCLFEARVLAFHIQREFWKSRFELVKHIKPRIQRRHLFADVTFSHLWACVRLSTNLPADHLPFKQPYRIIFYQHLTKIRLFSPSWNWWIMLFFIYKYSFLIHGIDYKWNILWLKVWCQYIVFLLTVTLLSSLPYSLYFWLWLWWHLVDRFIKPVRVN
jgi:hypothetical protein